MRPSLRAAAHLGRHGREGVHPIARRTRYGRPMTDVAVAAPHATADERSHLVATAAFEGPVDLLVHLVNSHEVDILDVPLTPIVDQFVAVLREHPETLGLGTRSQFVLMASILVEMKSQRLLPGPDAVEDEEELSGWEERDVLLARMLECRAYAATADVFVALSEQAARSVPREVGLDDGFVVHAPDLLAGVTPTMLADAYLRATAERPEPRVDLSHVTVDAVTVSETIQMLAVVLSRRKRASFRTLTTGLTNRIDVIVHFLALLELCKLGRVVLGQAQRFGDLDVQWIAEDHPLPEALVGVEDYDG